MLTKAIETITNYAVKFMETYLPAYFNWLTGKLSNVEPFSVLYSAAITIFILVIYIWFRNKNV